MVLAGLLLASAAACGKKGPPLPPLSTLPRAPQALSARLQGEQVQIRFRIPNATQSNIQPADLQRVDVYAITAERVQRDEFLKQATVVASVPVRRPVEEGEEEAPPAPGEEDALEQGALAVAFETLTPEAYKPVPLEEDEDEEKPRRRGRDGPIVVRRTALAPPDLGAEVPTAPVRHYVAVGVTRGGREGLPSVIASVTLEPPPPPPSPPKAEVRESAAVVLTWEPPAGLRQPIQRTTLAPKTPPRGGPARPGDPLRGEAGSDEDPDVFDEPRDDEDEPRDDDEDGELPAGDEEEPLAPEPDLEQPVEPEPEDEGVSGDTAAAEDARAPAPGGAAAAEKTGTPDGAAEKGSAFLPARPLLPWPSVTSGYHVYAVPAEPPADPPSPYSADALPELLTPRPVPKPEFTDAKARFGDERCYVIRVAEVVGTAIREGAPSQPACVKVADVFPPAPPRSLEAVASEGAVSLIWEASADADLAGYLVIRSEGVETRIQQLTPKPIAETTFRDTDVKPGVRYVYVVVAVDSADPPNRSGPSNAVEVTAR